MTGMFSNDSDFWYFLFLFVVFITPFAIITFLILNDLRKGIFGKETISFRFMSTDKDHIISIMREFFSENSMKLSFYGDKIVAKKGSKWFTGAIILEINLDVVGSFCNFTEVSYLNCFFPRYMKLIPGGFVARYPRGNGYLLNVKFLEYLTSRIPIEGMNNDGNFQQGYKRNFLGQPPDYVPPGYISKWRREDKDYHFTFIISIFGAIISTLLMLVIFPWSEFFELCCFTLVFLVMSVYYPFISGRRYYVKRGMVNKTIYLDHHSIILEIEKVLKYHGIPYQKLSSHNAIPKTSIIKYKEIFALENSNLKIKVQKRSHTSSIVDIGPVSDSNHSEIKKMKSMIDDAFNPRRIIKTLNEPTTDYVPLEYR